VTPLESGLAWTVDLAAARDFVGKERAHVAASEHARLVGLVESIPAACFARIRKC
jgi:glycine cleavage system aminomethyltransferase T